MLETTLPRNSTDKRVVRRRAALAKALAYEYKSLNWLAELSVNYKVEDGKPRREWER